jgi:hypothetical protein
MFWEALFFDDAMHGVTCILDCGERMNTLLLLPLLALSLAAQAISPVDDAEKARFDAVAAALEKAGYHSPMIAAHDGIWFAALATHEDKGALAIAIEPTPGAAVMFAVVEFAENPAAVGLRGIRFEPFLGSGDLTDVIVAHHPFQLESSREFDRHYVLRRTSTGLNAACSFNGNVRSGYAKGPRSVSSTHTVTLAKTSPATFQLTIVDETTERGMDTAQPQVTEHKEATVRYSLAPGGVCSIVP